MITHISTIKLTLYNQIVDLTISDQTYKIGDNLIELDVPRPFTEPPLQASYGEKIKGQSGENIVKSINIFKNNVLKDASLIATFDVDTNKITIHSHEESIIGGRIIRVTYEFQDYVYGE